MKTDVCLQEKDRVLSNQTGITPPAASSSSNTGTNVFIKMLRMSMIPKVFKSTHGNYRVYFILHRSDTVSLVIN